MSKILPTNECEAIRAELSAGLDDELEPPRQAAVEQHLASCEACRADEALLRLVSQAARQVPRLEPPSDRRSRLLARIAAQPVPAPGHSLAERMEILIIERPGEQIVYQQGVRAPGAGPVPSCPETTARPSSHVAVQSHEQRTGNHTTLYHSTEIG